MQNMRVDFEFGSSAEYTNLGCSPQLLVKLTDWLHSLKGRVSKIDVALYLFNNRELYEALSSLADETCQVTVYSIPLEGYDNRYPMPVYDAETHISGGEKTKYQLASSLYNDIINYAPQGFSLRIVPHMYLRSSRVNPFSRGNMPYSLHCKSLLVQIDDGSYYAALTSSNLAVRDASKYEMAFVAQLGAGEAESSVDFYEGLHDNSIDVRDFNPDGDYSHYRIKMRDIPKKSHFMYVAPFYRDSAKDFETNISSIVRKAENRIIVCAQHISSYDYYYERSYSESGVSHGTVRVKGFLNDVLNKSREGVATAFLSQTYADAGGSHGCRIPENKRAFIKFASAAQTSNCRYFVNKNVHCKFIVADDVVLITTCNFTPTQFIYLSNVIIPKFEKIPGYSYSGIHCEIGLYVAVRNRDLANRVVEYYEAMVNKPDTKKMF